MALRLVKLLFASIVFTLLTKFVRRQLKPVVNPQTNVNTGVKAPHRSEEPVPCLNVFLPFQLGMLRSGIVLLPRENSQVRNPVRARNGSSWRKVVTPSVPVETPIVELGTCLFNPRDSRRVASHAHYVAGDGPEVLPDGWGCWRERVDSRARRRGRCSHTRGDLLRGRCRARADACAGSV